MEVAFSRRGSLREIFDCSFQACFVSLCGIQWLKAICLIIHSALSSSPPCAAACSPQFYGGYSKKEACEICSLTYSDTIYYIMWCTLYKSSQEALIWNLVLGLGVGSLGVVNNNKQTNHTLLSPGQLIHD